MATAPILSAIAPIIKNWANSVFALIGHNHSSDYEPKNANIQSHISNTTNPHAVDKSQVGLGNVTNDAQVKKAASSTDGKIAVWDGATGDKLKDGYAVETTMTTTDLAVPTSNAVLQALSDIGATGSAQQLPGVQDIDALKAIDTTDTETRPDKVIILVEDYGLYRLDRESSETESSPLIIAPTTGSGRWYKTTPTMESHNLMSNKQGGTTNEYYHMTAAQNAALAGSAGTPGGSNKFVTQEDAILDHLNLDGTIDHTYVIVSDAGQAAFAALFN